MKIVVTGESGLDEISVNGGQQSRIIDVTAGLVSSVNGKTGNVTVTAADTGAVTSVNGRTGIITGLAETDDVQEVAEAAAGPVAAEAIAGHAAAPDPHGDRAAATTALGTHAASSDPHGDRSWATGQFLPKAGGTLTGPVTGPGGFAVAVDGGIATPSLTLPATATTVSKSLVITAPAGPVSYTVWRAPKACTVTAVRGYRAGGTGATINAQKNGADLLATDLSLSTATTWLSGPSVQNASIAAGDSLTIAIRSTVGTPTAVTIQVDLQGV